MTPVAALAQSTSEAITARFDPLAISIAGAAAMSVAAVMWALRVSNLNRNQSIHWSKKLAEMEARLEKSESILSSHPGIVLVWDDDKESAASDWGAPRMLGGAAALASLMSLSNDAKDRVATPSERLLSALGELNLIDDAGGDPSPLKNYIDELRRLGVGFTGHVATADGRTIELDGRVAGDQVTLWITDPAVRMAEDGAVLGAFRQTSADLHGSHAMLERAPAPAWRRDASMNLIWVNKAYADLVEAANPIDVIRQQIELDGNVKKSASEATRERKPAQSRAVINSDGARRVFQIFETPLSRDGETVTGGFAVEITELDKARADLKQHVEANKRTLDQIKSAVVIFGANQNLIYCNRAFQKLWELEDAALAGRVSHGEWLDMLRLAGKLPEPPDYDVWRNAQLALYTSALSAPGSERDGGAPDEIWNLPDGRTLWMAKQRHPLGGVMAVFEDITEKIALEAQYNTQLRVQKATLNNLAEGVAVFEGDGALKLYNRAFQKMWRLDQAMLDTRPHIDSILTGMESRLQSEHQPLKSLRRCVTSKSSDARTPMNAQELVLDDGRIMAFGTEPLPDGATLAHFLDITDSKARETELQERNAILENADRLKSKFVDHVSYQLRTPLSTIIGFSEMLDGEMFGVLNDRQKDYVASILTASYHLRDLINDIIDLAAIDAGKLEIEPKPCDIRNLLENAATFAALKAEDTQVALTLDCDKDIGEIEIDERRMKQVLFNLLSNAFAYTDAGGTVTLGAARENGLVRIWISDTGRGLSAADQAKAFDAFESRGPSAGAGLGLSLVERFIALHGGWTRLESNEGAGAVVTCYLPLEDPSAATHDSEQVVELTKKSTSLESPESPRRTRRKTRTSPAARRHAAE